MSAHMFPFRRCALLLGPCAVVLSSCSTRWSSEQKSFLADVSLAPTTVAADAYQNPQPPRPPKAQYAPLYLAYYPGAIAAELLDRGWTASRQREFDRRNKRYYSELARKVPTRLASALDRRLLAALQNDSYFASRLTTGSANKFTSKIVSYGLLQTGKDTEGKPLVGASITVEIKLSPQSTGNFFEEGFLDARPSLEETIVGVSKHRYSVSSFTSDKLLIEDAFGEALDSVISQFNSELNRRIGRSTAQ